MPPDPVQRRSRVVLIAAICVFSTQFGVTVIAPLLGTWVAASSTPFLVAALIFSAFTLVSTPLTIPGGILSDRMGRKPLIIAGLLLFALASFLFPFATEPWDWIVIRAVQGAGAGLFFPALTALLAEVTSHAERGQAMSGYNIGLGLGLAVGPASGGVLFDRYGIFEPFLVCTALALFSAALVFLFLEEPKQREHSSEERLQLSGEDRKALTLACSMIFFGIGVAAIMGALFSPYVAVPEGLKLSAGCIGALLSTLFMVFAVLQLLLNRVMTLVGDANLARAGLVLCAGGLVVLSFATSLGELVLMSVLLGAGLGAVSLGTLTMVSRAASEGEGERAEERVRHGKVMGIYYTAFYAGLGGIPLVCGALSEVFGAQPLFLAYALLLLVVMLLVWRLAGRSPD